LPPSSSGAVVGSEIREPGWKKIRIRDKQPGSATRKKCVKRYILLDTEAEVCNGAGEVSLDEDFLYVEWYLT
jgi:hypothetical protein